ncbi:unnamed protein product [Protopolystoma xenopodis]|uniref:Uncharacterized protein n=1 Tax=Protopolystoma xenopodis TaxID=117903 RepID=A0A448WJN2_9PLAT|nr:unnamed protein product [Protopolystoma xenopodis]
MLELADRERLAKAAAEEAERELRKQRLASIMSRVKPNTSQANLTLNSGASSTSSLIAPVLPFTTTVESAAINPVATDIGIDPMMLASEKATYLGDSSLIPTPATTPTATNSIQAFSTGHFAEAEVVPIEECKSNLSGQPAKSEVSLEDEGISSMIATTPATSTSAAGRSTDAWGSDSGAASVQEFGGLGYSQDIAHPGKAAVTVDWVSKISPLAY